MPVGSAPLVFSTKGIATPRRARALRTLHEQGLLPVEPLSDRVPRVELAKWRLPGASVLWGRFDGVRQVGEPGASGTPDELFFGINVSGSSLARQGGREIAVGAGDAVAIGVGENAFSVLRPEACRMIGVRVPRRVVPLDREDLGAPLRHVPSHTAPLQLLARYLDSLFGGPVPACPQLADAVVTHLTELIALSLGPADPTSSPAADRSVRAARTSAIKADVDRHLTDPRLTVAAVASRHGITTRYLHKLFEEEAQTFSQFVLDRRLGLAYRRLRNPRFADRTISAIAGDTGFGDLSYFNRVFRRRYQITPSQARHAELDERGASAGYGSPDRRAPKS